MTHATSTTTLLHTRIGIGGTITLELFGPHLLAEPGSQAGEPAHGNLVLIGVAAITTRSEATTRGGL